MDSEKKKVIKMDPTAGDEMGPKLSAEDKERLGQELEKRLADFRKKLVASLKSSKRIYVMSKEFELDGVEFDAFKCICSVNELLLIVDNKRPVEGGTIASMFHASDEEMIWELSKGVKTNPVSLGDLKAMVQLTLDFGVQLFDGHNSAPDALKPEFMYVLHESNSLRYSVLQEMLKLKLNK